MALDLQFKNFSITGDEDSYCLSFTGQVQNLLDWMNCVPGKELTIELNGNIYIFKIDSRNRSRVFGEDQYEIEARSPTSVLGDGSSPIYKDWGIVTAQEVCQEMCDMYDITLNYQIIDWSIPSGRLSAEGETPIGIINKIVQAAGAIVQTTPGGELLITSRHPSSPVSYDIGSVALTISDVDDIFNLEEISEINPKYNAVEVMDVSPNDQSIDSISEVSEEEDSDMQADGFVNPVAADTVRIKVVRFPFVASVDLLTSANNVIINPIGKYNRELTEIVEIVNGEGSTSNLISSVTAWNYQDADLGSATFDGRSVITSIAEQSLISITYITEFHVFDVSHDQDRSIQVYVEELGE